MDMDLVVQHLRQYNDRERIYKEYYDLRGDPAAQEQLARRYMQNDTLHTRRGMIDNWLFFPEVFPDQTPQDLFFSDELFFDPSADVMVLKHDRYTPLFTHTHTIFEISYVLTGACQQHIAGGDLRLKEGDFCFIALETPHSIGVFDDSIVLNILLKKNTFDDIYMHALRNKSILTSFFFDSLYDEYKTDYIIFHTGDDLNIRDLLLDMYVEQFEWDEYSNNQLTCMMSILLSRLMRGYAKTAELPVSRKKDNSIRIEILNYLQNNYRTATLPDMAEYFHYSTSYCSRLIKESTGRTFAVLLQDIRLRQAEALLRTSNAGIEQISTRVGYENPESFSRAFKKQRGLTPTQFREQEQKEL